MEGKHELDDETKAALEEAAQEDEREKKEDRRSDTKYGGGIGDSL